MTKVDTSSKVRRERISVSSAALFDILLIAVMFFALSSKFVLAPGFSIDLTATKIPTTAVFDNVVVDEDLSVLNAKSGNMIIFDGAIFTPESFAKKMSSYGRGKTRGVLLLKIDKNVDSQTLIDICNAAKAGGFKKIHIAAEPVSN